MTQTIATSRRQAAETLAYQVRRFPNMYTSDELCALAPQLSPAGRTDALATLIDAITLRDALTRIAVVDPWLAAEHLHLINPKTVPAGAVPAYTAFIVAARTRRAVAVRDRDHLAGLDEAVDTAMEFAAQVDDGGITVCEVEPELAHPEVLWEAAEQQLAEALGCFGARVRARMDAAFAVLERAVAELFEAAIAPLSGGAQ